MLVIVKSRGQEATLVDVMAIIDEMRARSLGRNKVGYHKPYYYYYNYNYYYYYYY